MTSIREKWRSFVATQAAAANATIVGYAVRTTGDDTTNTDQAAAPSNKISGLSVTIVGDGLPKVVEFYCAGVVHSAGPHNVGAALVVNGALLGGEIALQESPSTDPVTLLLRRIFPTTVGVSYTFEIGKFVFFAGTASYIANATAPMHLLVQR